MSSSHCADPGPGAAEIGTASDYNFFKRTTRGDRMMVKKVLNNSLGSCCFFIFGVCIFTFNLLVVFKETKIKLVDPLIIS